MQEQLDNTKSSLERLQDYDVGQLPREAELGNKFSFNNAVEPAQRVLSLFKQIPTNQLEELPENELAAIQQQADGLFNLLESIKEFDPEKPEDTMTKRDQIVAQIEAHRQQIFTQIFPLISYLTTRMTDFSKLESDARAAVQAVKDDADTTAEALAKHEESAKNILENVQKVAAEQGVSQQAIYYKEESETHDSEAKKWRNLTVATAVGLGAFAVLSLFIHKWEWLGLIPNTSYDTIQLALSKVLIFGVIAYMLLLCARNFLAHTHNAIVNKHRQNALLTFTALADAAQDTANQDIVLTHAAECIFSPQETGYTKQASIVPSSAAQTVVRTLPRVIGQTTKGLTG